MSSPAISATTARCCTFCGSEISHRVSRVIGDNQGNVPCCSNCFVLPNGEEFTSDAHAVRNFIAEGKGRRRGRGR